MVKIERPLDLLNNYKGKDVLILSRDGGQLISGKLLAFDIHINIVLENAKFLDSSGKVEKNMGDLFLRGDTIIFISGSKL